MPGVGKDASCTTSRSEKELCTGKHVSGARPCHIPELRTSGRTGAVTGEFSRLVRGTAVSRAVLYFVSVVGKAIACDCACVLRWVELRAIVVSAHHVTLVVTCTS